MVPALPVSTVMAETRAAAVLAALAVMAQRVRTDCCQVKQAV